MKPIIRSLVLSVVFIASSPAASAIVIDDFSQGALFIQVTNLNGQTVYQSGLSTSGVLGGTRSVYAGSLAQATAAIDTSARQFRFSSDSSFGYFTLTEGGTSSPFGTDLTADGSDAFAINITQLTLELFRGIYDFGVETYGSWFIYDLRGDLSALNGSGVVTIPFTSFPGVDMRHLQAVRIDAVRFEPSSQIVIGSIAAVPEPSFLAAFAGACGVLALLLKFTGQRNQAMHTNCRSELHFRHTGAFSRWIHRQRSTPAAVGDQQRLAAAVVKL